MRKRPMDTRALTEASTEARQHADNAKHDIKNAADRLSHIRATALAMEAEKVALTLETLVRLSAKRDNELDFPLI